MSGENAELARAALAAFTEVDEGLVEPQRLEEFFAADVVTTFSGLMNEETVLRGFDEFLQWRAAWIEPYDEWSYEPVKIIDAGANRVVVTLHQRGRPRGSESWVEMDYGLVYTVEEGLISRVEFHATPDGALEAAGLRE
jgi:ketosteroid isomerase-like protein